MCTSRSPEDYSYDIAANAVCARLAFVWQDSLWSSDQLATSAFLEENLRLDPCTAAPICKLLWNTWDPDTCMTSSGGPWMLFREEDQGHPSRHLQVIHKAGQNWKEEEEESLHLDVRSFPANSGLIRCLVPHGRAS